MNSLTVISAGNRLNIARRCGQEVSTSIAMANVADISPLWLNP
jgi:hypothetical protein